MYYNRARYLDVNRGRFWSQDSFEGTISEPLTLHKYVYGNGNPVSNTDPSGNYSIKSLAITALIATVLASITAISLNSYFASGYLSQTINLEDQPVIVQGSGWVAPEGILSEASAYWKSEANINVSRRKTVTIPGCINSTNCPLQGSIDSNQQAVGEVNFWNSVEQLLIQNNITTKHVTIFVGDIKSNSVPGRTRTNQGAFLGISLISLAAIGIAGFITTHEWGHSFNLRHVDDPNSPDKAEYSYFNLMLEKPSVTDNDLTDNQIKKARLAAIRYR